MTVITLNAKFTDEAPSSVPYRTSREKILGKMVFQTDPVGPSPCFQYVTVGAVCMNSRRRGASEMLLTFLWMFLCEVFLEAPLNSELFVKDTV